MWTCLLSSLYVAKPHILPAIFCPPPVPLLSGRLCRLPACLRLRHRAAFSPRAICLLSTSAPSSAPGIVVSRGGTLGWSPPVRRTRQFHEGDAVRLHPQDDSGRRSRIESGEGQNRTTENDVDGFRLKQKIPLRHRQHGRGFARQQHAVRPHFIGLRIDLDMRQRIIVDH